MRIFVLSATEGGLEAARVFAAAHPLAGYIALGAERDNRDVAGFADGRDFCRQRGVARHEVRSYALSDPADRALIDSLGIDVLLVTGWQRLLPEAVIRACGSVLGVHGSPLGIAGGRGRSPQNWALIRGCARFHLSVFRITPGIDSGEILASRTFAYNLRDDIRSSYLKVAYLTGELMASLAREGRLQAAGEQQDEAGARYLPRRPRSSTSCGR
jgi:UDP-4-amino-4-deoxy-L-arabinose formyltransferase/UDP-glucuronic acid dehydrogenase (UDP-4-keto-hexauronic acid decarboxylating)